MEILLIAAGILILAFGLSLMGRRNHPKWKALEGWSYAHRGLHGSGVPENSMAAFRLALEAGYGIELDVHLLRDGTLAVMHDSSLKRTAGREGVIEDLTAEELETIRLEGTEEAVPLFSQVLELFAGNAPMIVELKTWKDNGPALCQAVCNMLESYSGPYCIESFDPRAVYWLKKHAPEIIRGQLAENFVRSNHTYPWILRFALTNHMMNFLTRPDFIAYRFADRKSLPTFLCRRLWGIRGVSWTLRSPEEYQTARAESWIPIFEHFRPDPEKNK